MSVRPPPPPPEHPPDPGLGWRAAAADGVTLAGRVWEPQSPPRGEILLVHGLNEHLGRHAGTASRLAARGWRVRGVDLRGHGRSDGQRGHVRRWQDYHLDLAAAAPRDAFVVLAHSMGGLVALDWLLAAAGPGHRARGLILSSPLLGLRDIVPPWKLALGRVLARVLPVLPIPSGIDPAGLALDLDVVRAWREDPLAGSTVTPRWFEEMEAALARVHGGAGRLRVPVQLHVAPQDPLVDPSAALRFAAALPEEPEILAWQHSLHEPLHDLEREAVLAAILRWLDQSPGSSRSSSVA